MRPHVATATPGEPMPNNRRARPTVPARQRRRADAAEEPEPERVETPPPHYWRRWTGDAPPADATDPIAIVRTMPDSAHVPEATHVAAAAGEPPYRVLIVEDDRAQALFAEGVLNGAGIEALVASEPNDVLETMARFRPDLVLMDLHMPGLSGTELTALIRAQEAFLHTPIVFLTGDPDPEKQYEVLESGADDFLNKPIRPRHLVAAVQSRVKRARALGQQRLGDAGRHPLTGLMTRGHLLQRLGNALPSKKRGGVLFVEIEGFGSLRDRYGYAALERLMTEAGRVLAGLVGSNPATRLNDNAFLVFAPETGPDRLEDMARGLRDGIGRHLFETESEAGGLKLRVAIGHAALRHGFTEAGTALEAAEQALRQARLSPIGLAAYAPPTNEDAERGRELAVALREALAEDRFELAYQPIVAVAGGEEAQYQALLRLRDADGTLHTAAHIVPAAEAAGLIQDIDRWVLESAIDTLQKRCREQRPVRLFVSQSPRTLAREGYGEWLAGAIAAQGIDGPSLVIDVPLADALIHSVTLRQFCERMVPAGVQFCLSRFQHGEEADALMAQLPLGYVRLAARYADGDGDGALRDEMRLAIDLAHRQGLQVIGQQVEDPQAAATLWMSGIDYIQGNLVQQAGGDLDFDFQHAVL
jgi:diguanylate cyclase (GGDEF)-like protein